eukprot:CAMPEP_0180260150 /NCGR_PEP_ID=MMETSP0987-20121128/43419_1 /TAXON_ID=697907 /ORGANISM="non described non described, Strain CCMP2293" /LENGTH=150 /DNA_ID=CAMNT_0022229943 /DNA_START=3 /DNA_END=453 /DNA_ORIENTATION=+
MYRRAFAKRNESGIAEFEAALHATNRSGLVAEAQALLKDAGKYSFCKSHAMSYAHLCWALAVEKACNLRKFWEAHRSVVANEGALCFRPWVYEREALRVGAIKRSVQTHLTAPPSKLQQLRATGAGQAPASSPGASSALSAPLPPSENRA